MPYNGRPVADILAVAYLPSASVTAGGVAEGALRKEPIDSYFSAIASLISSQLAMAQSISRE